MGGAMGRDGGRDGGGWDGWGVGEGDGVEGWGEGWDDGGRVVGQREGGRSLFWGPHPPPHKKCPAESPARYSNKELKGMLVWAPNQRVSDAKCECGTAPHSAPQRGFVGGL